MSIAAASVDRHVVIVTAAGSFTAAGERLTGPVDAVNKLEKLIEWAHTAAACSRSARPASAPTQSRRGSGWSARRAGC